MFVGTYYTATGTERQVWEEDQIYKEEKGAFQVCVLWRAKHLPEAKGSSVVKRRQNGDKDGWSLTTFPQNQRRMCP